MYAYLTIIFNNIHIYIYISYNNIYIYLHIHICTHFIAIKHGNGHFTFMVDFLIKPPICRGFSIAMFDFQRAHALTNMCLYTVYNHLYSTPSS